MPMEILTTTKLESVWTLAREWGIGDDWDVLIVGDGSGGGWHLPNGWAAALIDRQTRGRREFFGGTNTGTINIAELAPYAQAMAWYAERRRRLMRLGKPVQAICRVHIVTDHDAVALTGRELARRVKTVRDVPVNRPEWARLMAYEWEGFVFDFHWIRRATVALNCWADDQARACFQAMKDMPRPSFPDGAAVSSYDCNGDDDGAGLLRFLKPVPPRGQRRKPPGFERACPAEADE